MPRRPPVHLNYYGTCDPLQSSPSGSDVPAETIRNELTCSPYLLVLSRHGVTTASAVTRGHTETVQPLEPTYATWSSTCLPHQCTTCGNLCRHLTSKPTQSTIKCQNLGRTPAAHATMPKPHTSPEAACTSATSATTTSSLALSRLKRPIGHRLQRL